MDRNTSTRSVAAPSIHRQTAENNKQALGRQNNRDENDMTGNLLKAAEEESRREPTPKAKRYRSAWATRVLTTRRRVSRGDYATAIAALGMLQSPTGAEKKYTMETELRPAFVMKDRHSLLSAAAEGNVDVMARLLPGNLPELNDTDHLGRSPLSLAAGNGHLPVVEMLLAHKGIDTESRDENGRTALSWASGNGHWHVAKALLGVGANEKMSKDAHDSVSVSRAAAAERIVKSWLLSPEEQERNKRPDPNSRDTLGRTPLIWAAFGGHGQVVRLLLRQDKVSFFQEDYHGRTPLSWAVAAGRVRVASLLLAQGGILPIDVDFSGRTPLLWAAAMGQPQTVQLLLAQPGVEVDGGDAYGRTPLSWAAARGYEGRGGRLLGIQQVEFEVTFGSSGTGGHGGVPLSSTPDDNFAKIVRLLLATEEIDVNSEDWYGRTPLSWAAEHGNLSLVNILLLHKDIDVNSVDDHHMTPLLRVICGGEKKMNSSVEEVVSESSDDNASGTSSRSSTGAHSTLDVSTAKALRQGFGWLPTRQERSDVAIRLLQESNIDPNIEDEQGRTPLFWAKKLGQTEIMKALVAAGAIDSQAQISSDERVLPDAITHSPPPEPMKDQVEMASMDAAGIVAPKTPKQRPKMAWILVNEVAKVVLHASGMIPNTAALVVEQRLEIETVQVRFEGLLTQYYRDLRSTAYTAGHVPLVWLIEDARPIISRMTKRSLRSDPSRPLYPTRLRRDRKGRAARYFFNLLNSQFKESLPEPTAHEAAAAAAAWTFLVEGQPMSEFRSNLRKFVNRVAWEQNMLRTSRSFPRSLPDLVDVLFHSLQFRLWEPAVPRGKRRVKWTCSCGINLYDDFNEASGHIALDKLEDRLNAKGAELANASQGRAAVTGYGQQAARSLTKWAESIKSFMWPSEQSVLPSHRSNSTIAPSQSPSIELDSSDTLYLLHCRSSGRYGISFNQDLIHDDLNDRTLFQFLRSVLRRVQKGNKWLTLRNTTCISLSKFHVDHSRQAQMDYCEGCMQQRGVDCVCVPPPDLVGREYRCHPTPPKRRPPFGKNYLMHYLLNPEHLSREQTWAYRQLPKRMAGPLQLDPEYTTPGWGLYFEDGWNFKTIYLLLFLANVVGSLLFGICWGVFKMDVQGAFGITSYWIGVVAVGMGGLVLSSTHQL